jgi:hypothetical protein
MCASYLGITSKEKQQDNDTDTGSAEIALQSLGAPSKALSPAQIIMQQIQRDQANGIRSD